MSKEICDKTIEAIEDNIVELHKELLDAPTDSRRVQLRRSIDYANGFINELREEGNVS